MYSTHNVRPRMLGNFMGHNKFFNSTRRLMRLGVISNIGCHSRVRGFVGTGISGYGFMSLTRVIGTPMDRGCSNGGITILCTANNVSSKDRANVISRSVIGRLGGLTGSSGVGTIILHIGSPNNDTFNSRRV